MTETTTEAEAPVRLRARRLTGARELTCIEDCATGDMSIEELADKYEVEPHTIENFKGRHRRAIAAAAAKQLDANAHLWITRKELRLATWQAEADRCIRLIEDIEAACADISESTGMPISPDTDKISRLQSNLFRALAAIDSLDDGEGPKTLRHRIEGLEGWPNA